MKNLFAVNFLLLVLSFTTGLPSNLADGPEEKDTGIPNEYYQNEENYPNDIYVIYPDLESTNSFNTEEPLERKKRQASLTAIDLASNHQGPVGKINPKFDLSVTGNNARNYHAQGGLGAGTVVFRSKNDRHSLGVGAYAQQQGGRFEGFRYKSKPDFGAGIGYKFKF